MRIFSFLKNHKLSFLIALVLLFAQANFELTLPGVMSDIVDVGISQGGISSTVPDEITSEDLASVELFLSDAEVDQVEPHFSEPDADGVRTFTGSRSDRESLEGFMGEAEMLAYQFMEGVSIDEFAAATESAAADAGTAQEAPAAPADPVELMRQMFGDTIDIADIERLVDAGVVTKDQLVESRETLTRQLGDNGDSIIQSRAIEFVESAYRDAGVDLTAVQSNYLFSQGLTMLGYALASAACAILAALNASRTSAAIGRDLRHQLYERVLDYSPAEMGKFSAASLITRATNDIQQIQMITVMCLRIVLFAPCMGLGAVVRVLTTPTGMEWILVVAIVAIAIAIGVLMGVTMPKFRIMQSLVDRNNLIAREILTGIMPIRAFGRQKHEEERYDEANRELTSTYIFTNRCMTFLMPVMMIVMNATTVGIVWFGAQGVDAGNLQVGTLMAYINYVMQVIMSFMILTMISVMLPRAGVAADRVQEVLDTQTSIKNPEPEARVTRERSEGWKGVVSYNDVTFTYPDADVPTLENISFTAEPGKTVAIIGSTGCGKSTLVQLIPRLYDVTEGSITLDGVDIRNIDLAELRRTIGYVPQKRMLFSGTIESNIKYGDESMGDEDMVQAAQIAQATEFIEGKPDGYSSPISQGGTNVSGGQNQRLSIARALAIHPKVLVFDDSFSALDYKTDATLRAELDQRCSDSTVIIVAQRIATIMHADEILVLDDGRIVGRGTHAELLRSCPEYLEIAKSQLSESELGLDETAHTASGQSGDKGVEPAAAAEDSTEKGGER
ncbi:ABC transporter ATP-binding protein [Collinsella ihumii]|uniref:ABC transporter ATP-binding protein n=1 Tax=Collinsella ihumii TaxID=1720204 RepID=A0AAW7JPJ7_9ACTN|nr:ABC transporter ATP-binding protein [Collinsella ihumii]MDN0068327.1 ABC transporter ATP-binding protein [Collinsella ihumii]